jgi:tetratricopeptide (TPR) repeat protein
MGAGDPEPAGVSRCKSSQIAESCGEECAMADVQRLDGWKAIGNFLGRDRTTAIRWARDRGLPVHRVPGGRTGTVFALPAELTAWLAQGSDSAPAPEPPTQTTPPPLTLLPRRRLLAGGALVAGGGILGLAAFRRSPAPALEPPTEFSAQVMNQAQLAFAQGKQDGQNQAIGLLQRVVAEQPRYADGWGALAMMYACSAHWRDRPEADRLRSRARAAAERAELLDPTNSYASVARATSLPVRGNWLQTEQALRRTIARYPEHEWTSLVLGWLLGDVGRNAESAAVFAGLRARTQPNPWRYYHEIMALWGANRLEEADRLMDEATQLYPGHLSIWFGRLYVRLYTGRAAEARAMLDDTPVRPSGLPASEFDPVVSAVRAFATQSPSDVAEAMRIWRDRARIGNGYAETAIQLASAFGQVDDAYRLIEAFYFNRGFTLPDLRYSAEQGIFATVEDRPTGLLFWPNMVPVRRDPRFPQLIRELKLDRYWRESGRAPDYMRAERLSA